MDILKVAGVIKDYGINKAFKAISFIGWFVFPFAFWFLVYQHFGPTFLTDNTILTISAIACIIYLITLLMVMIPTSFQIVRLDTNMMKNVETVKQVFEDPTNQEAEDRLETELSKFIIPYLHYSHTLTSGFFNMSASLSLPKRILLRIFQIFLSSYLSYSLLSFIVRNRQVIDNIILTISQNNLFSGFFEQINPFLQIFIQNPIPSTILAFILTLFFIGMVTRKVAAIDENLYEPFSIINKFAISISVLAVLPKLGTRKRRYSLKPFTFWTELPLLMKKCVKNITKEECEITQLSYNFKTIDDVKILKRQILNQEDIPKIIRFICQKADCEQALQRITKSEPTLYFATNESKCVVLGRIEYDDEEKVYSAKFTFENEHLKKEFKDISENQRKEQKRLKTQLPKELSQLLGYNQDRE